MIKLFSFTKYDTYGVILKEQFGSICRPFHSVYCPKYICHSLTSKIISDTSILNALCKTAILFFPGNVALKMNLMLPTMQQRSLCFSYTSISQYVPKRLKQYDLFPAVILFLKLMFYLISYYVWPKELSSWFRFITFWSPVYSLPLQLLSFLFLWINSLR